MNDFCHQSKTARHMSERLLRESEALRAAYVVSNSSTRFRTETYSSCCEISKPIARASEEKIKKV